jgi:small subunit ribosomal protein S4
VYRLGMGASRPQARQTVVHGHILVNGRRVDRPSYLVNAGDRIEPLPKEVVQKQVKETRETTKGREMVAWLEIDDDPMMGRVVSLPKAEELPDEFNTHLIVEFFAR